MALWFEVAITLKKFKALKANAQSGIVKILIIINQEAKVSFDIIKSG